MEGPKIFLNMRAVGAGFSSAINQYVATDNNVLGTWGSGNVRRVVEVHKAISVQNFGVVWMQSCLLPLVGQ